MNFSSIKEYFYKMYSYCFLIMLIPMGLLGLVHMQGAPSQVQPLFIDASSESVSTVLLGIALIILTIVHLYGRARLKRIIKMGGLGNKMDHYFYLTITRVAAGTATCFVIIGGYVLTLNEWTDLLFFLTLAWIGFQLPSSRKACRELKLRGDEYEMIYFKKDTF
jgi:threonine/homoserine efflux transporter RhtA